MMEKGAKLSCQKRPIFEQHIRTQIKICCKESHNNNLKTYSIVNAIKMFVFGKYLTMSRITTEIVYLVYYDQSMCVLIDGLM